MIMDGIVGNDRGADRRPLARLGQIISSESNSRRECLIINLSANGAKLMCRGAADVPDKFQLLVVTKKYMRDAVVKWRDGDTIGVYFTSGPIRH